MNYKSIVAKVIQRSKGRKVIKPKKPRSYRDRLKARMYYRRNRSKIRLKRKIRYRKNKLYTSLRTRMKGSRPKWIKKKR